MNLTLEEIRSISYAILKHFVSFCDLNDIRYFLSNGTLLGAIKYNGFIPWDDDVDVFVPREDYDRLIEIYRDSEKFRLFSSGRVENYRFTFAKLCDMSTRKVEDNIDSGVQLGVDIDIFPLDCCSAHILRPFVQKRLRILQVGCILSKFITAEKYPIGKRLVIGCCRFLKFDFFCRRLSKLIEKERRRGDAFCGCLMWPIYGEREIVPCEVFREAVSVKFEGEEFFAPIGYDVYLRSLYGAYEQDPPPEKQRSHHSYTAYRI